MSGATVRGTSVTGSVRAHGTLGAVRVTGLTIVDVGDKDLYPGPYEVTPRLAPQTMETAGTVMAGNMLVRGIPYAETTNDYGTTVTIAS